MKKIALIIVLLLLAAAGIIEYTRLKKQEIPPSNAIAAVPINASFIMEVPRAYALIRNLTQTNLMWQELMGTEYVSKLNQSLHFLDSLTIGHPEIHNIFDQNPLFIAGVTSGQDHFGYLYCCPAGATTGQPAAEQFLKSIFTEGQFNETEYEGTAIYCLKKPGWSDFYCAFLNGIAVASEQLALVQQSLRQMDKNISLRDNKYFTKVLGTSDQQSMANLFINFQEINDAAEPFISRNFRSELLLLNSFAEWMELDLNFTPNEAIMNGFTDADTLSSQFLQLFNGQTLHQPSTASVLPVNTALMCSFELSDLRGFMKRYKKFLDGHRKLYKRNEWMEAVERTYGINPENYFYRWFGNEMTLAITEPSDSALQNNTYAIVNTGDPKDAADALDSLASITAQQGKQPFSTDYMNHRIGRIELDGILPNILGETFEQLKQCYFTICDNYVIFSNTADALKSFISQIDGGNTLAKDPYYRSFVKDHVADESGIYIYNNIALSSVLYEQQLDKDNASALKEHLGICKKFQALAIQFTPMQGMFYTNAYLKYNPQYKKQAGALWQASLDTTLAITPCWVTDFHTGNKFILVQDVADNSYLISNTGQIQWKRKLEGRMQGEAHDIDALGNGKIQFLFNTPDNIYALDRKGNNVAGFPVKLTSPAAGPVSLFDYDNNKKYRIIVCTGNKRVLEYDLSGNPVKDWQKPETMEKITCPLKHVTINDKDYLLAVDADGNLYAWNRKGETRIKFHHKLPPHLSSFYCTGFADMENTFIWAADSSGAVYRLSFTDELTRESYLSGSYRHISFALADLEGKGSADLIFQAPEELYAYNINKSHIFRFSAGDTLSPQLFTFTFADGKTRIGSLEPAHNRIYLWDSKGNVCNGFPLSGCLGFSIAEMNNDGQNYLVTGSGTNLVYVYSLP